jgi:hypothetical protein
MRSFKERKKERKNKQALQKSTECKQALQKDASVSFMTAEVKVSK